jgi:ABC-2 type transport system ATP-binding protein
MIRVENLYKKFGRFDALRGLSFDVPDGSAFALIGANGAGKTTTIKVLMNIFEPTRGSATLLGVDSRKVYCSTDACLLFVRSSLPDRQLT